MWRFLSTEEDGQQWMNNPATQSAAIEFAGRGVDSEKRYRVTVVTKAWLRAQLESIGGRGPRYLLLSPLLVLPDVEREGLRQLIDEAVRGPGMSNFATVASDVWE